MLNQFPARCCSLLLLAGAVGCAGSPSKANIELRKQNQTLQSQLDDINRAHTADAATIHSLQDEKGSLPTLPQDRLDKLYTSAGISLGRLTGPMDSNPQAKTDGGVKVYVAPVDASDDPIKAAGSFSVDLFDLAAKDETRIGHWDFDLDLAKKYWFGRALLYTYVLPCPWQDRKPAHSDLTLRVTFHDELTGREFTTQKLIHVHAQP